MLTRRTCLAPMLALGFVLGDSVSVSAMPEEPLRDVFARVSPAVVVVRTKGRGLNPLGAGVRGQRFVGIKGLGSGFYVSADPPLVLTAAHVVQTADAVQVEFAGGHKSRATIESSSPSADVALLRLVEAPRDVAPVVLADSDQASVGDPVFVVGAPYGLDHTLTVGHLGARRSSKSMLGELSELELFQTDAAINTGNSGGPMFSSDGKVIGIVSRILTRSGGFEGMGFAVPSNLARQLLLEEPTPWSGLEGYMLSDDLAKIFNLPQDAGLLVQRVARNSMAERIGLRSGKLHAEINSEKLLVGGDVLLAVGGIQVDVSPETRNKIRQHLRDLKEDADLKVEVLRAGEVVELSRRMGDL